MTLSESKAICIWNQYTASYFTRTSGFVVMRRPNVVPGDATGGRSDGCVQTLCRVTAPVAVLRPLRLINLFHGLIPASCTRCSSLKLSLVMTQVEKVNSGLRFIKPDSAPRGTSFCQHQPPHGSLHQRYERCWLRCEGTRDYEFIKRSSD